MWFRVFAIQETAPDPAALVGHLRGLGLNVEGHFGGDQAGWFKVDLALQGNGEPLHVERYQADEDDIRNDLNSWAAWLETIDENPMVPHLMQHMISSRQVFTFECRRDQYDEPAMQKLCQELCQYLAMKTRGVYQVDLKGFFAPDGKLLVKE